MTDLYDRHALLYDIAFDWDVDDEIDWLLERLEPSGAPVFEPGCGSGRMLVALARRGVESVGMTSRRPWSRSLAPGSLPSLGSQSVLQADMTAFDLGHRFGGAICPIDTLCHLRPGQLVRHLDCVARQLAPGAGYVEDVDLARGRERQRSRIEVLAGEGAGEVIEEDHVMTAWTPATFANAIVSSQLTRVAAYDGDLSRRPAVDPDRAVGGLVWHELRASPRVGQAAGSASRPA